MSDPRIVCQFSCGAASAVATKLVIAQYPSRDIQIVNAFIKEEHPDNRRFLADCEQWFGRSVTVLRDEKYDASTHVVFNKKRFMGGFKFGAPCSRALKKDVLDAYRLPSDIMVLGFTAEEKDRLDRFLDANNIAVIAPLIERGLTKADCLAIVERAGITIPLMYQLGYDNANCIGCVKGGEGYWNKIRRDFPDHYEELAVIQEDIGPGAYLFRNRATGERYSLRQLPPDAGRHNETLPDCSFFCEMAEQEISA